MKSIAISRDTFLQDSQGRTFADVINDPEQPFDAVLEFFGDPGRQRRMEESELHHDRPPLAGVVRELEAQPDINRFLNEVHADRSKRLRQAIGVVVRIIMEGRGWKKTGRKGSLGVRAVKTDVPSPRHNTGGLAFWFIRGERYELKEGMPFRSVRDRCRELAASQPPAAAGRKVARKNARKGARKEDQKDARTAADGRKRRTGQAKDKARRK
ncbi:MAG: hypothetical protein RIK87_15175 [Fuerstiella sp.]